MQSDTRLKSGDFVQVMSGRSKGKSGKIKKIDMIKARVFVEGVNTVKRHVKPSQKNPQGGVVDKESSIHWSAVQVVCGKCAKPVRMKMAVDGKTKKRVCVKCGQQIGN